MDNEQVSELVEETRAVKMLLILQLLGQGFKQAQIAKLSRVSEATMSRMLPKGIGKGAVGRFKKPAGETDV